MFLYIAIAIVNLCSEFSFFYMYYALQAKRFHIAKMMLLIVVPTIIILFISPLPKFLLAHFGISTLLTAHVINLALNLLFLIAVGEEISKKPHSTPCFPTCCGSSSPLDLQDSWTFAQADGTLLYIFHTF